ncbi:lycopene cyclase family protein [Candidatus Pelagibacter communis]|uniref:lycopene cyclase family protein n=1 Tax=Pelagibacter ubique TaxID=198252 RepID=UPI00065B3A32|nr:lycopene cyclase family protein [Candidatus Pelagibacter ubique]
MKNFDYIIIGGGCAGLSLAYELEINDKLKNKSLAIIEPRDEYKRDKTWSFWKVFPHNFDDCVKKSWDNFSINIPNDTKFIDCKLTPYQSIDTGKFYDKILSKLKLNENIKFFKNINDIELSNSIIFNSVPNFENKTNNLWQHFCGVEIETEKDFFDDQIFNLMDFACDQKNEVHFFYTLPFSKKSALVETTWISNLSNENIKDYDNQIDQYLKNHLNIRNYKINFKEEGSIPLFRNKNLKKLNEIYIGSAGDMTRLSTGYTFLNIQEHSKYIAENIENISKAKLFKIKKKYDFLDNIFLKVLRNNSSDMGEIFFKMFNSSPKTAINFLSNKSNFFEDLEIILKMPKWKFLKELF